MSEPAKLLFLLNDPAYGSERTFNALRLAHALVKREGVQARIFLMGDAVGSALAGQKTPEGYYSLERMLRACARRGATVGCCGSCLDARAISDGQLVEGVRRSSLEELADWTLWADRVLVF
jgi:uncharacterized protein involved in oxidation of intracellular sulfur